MSDPPLRPAGSGSAPPSIAGELERGAGAALVFALVAERLGAFYEHGQWLTEAQGAQLCAEWLSRSRRNLPLATRRRLSAISDDLAREMAASLSREAGLYTAHDMMEALDPNHRSELAGTLMAECARRVADGLQEG